MKKNKINFNMDKLAKAVPLSYVSTFDFGSPEITQIEKDSLKRSESIFVKKFKECSASQFEMCKALYEIQSILKKTGVFVEWYKYMGISKDRVYELLNRYKLYEEFTGDEEKIEWVTSLSELAITHLSRKDVEQEYLYEVFEKGLKKASDIELFLDEKRQIATIESSHSIPFTNLITNNVVTKETAEKIEENIISNNEVINVYKDIQEAVIVNKEIINDDITVIKKSFKSNIDKVRTYSSTVNTISKICETKDLIKECRKQLEKIEKELKEQEEKLINENNLKMFSNKK